MSLKKVFHTAIRVSSWSHAVAIGSIALILSACTDYVDKYEGDYKDDYGSEESFKAFLDKVDWDWSATCETGDWLWCAIKDGKYMSEATTGAKWKQFGTGNVVLEFLGKDDRAYSVLTDRLPEDLTPFLRQSGGIAVKLEKAEGSFEAGLQLDVSAVDFSSETCWRPIALVYSNEYPGAYLSLRSVSDIDGVETVSEWRWKLQQGNLITEIFPYEDAEHVSGWQSIRDFMTKPRKSMHVAIVLTENANVKQGLNIIAVGLSEVCKNFDASSSSGTAKSSSSTKGGSTTTTSTSTSKIEFTGNWGSCAPAKETIISGESTTWSFTWNTAEANISNAELLNATYQWSFDGGSPASENGGRISSKVSYSGKGNKTATVKVTAGQKYGTVTCSEIEVLLPGTSSSSTASSSSVEGFLWKGHLKSGDVKNDVANGAKWYEYTDAEVRAGTIIQRPEGNTYEQCYGNCGMVWYDESFISPFAGIGFDLNQGGGTFDVTGWKGLCIAYKSDRDLLLRLDPENADAYNHVLPQVVLGPVPKDSSYRIRNFLWENFSDANGGVSAEQIAKELKGIFVAFEGTAGDSLFFNVLQIGSYERCGDVVVRDVDKSQFKRPATAWDYLNPNISYGDLSDSRDGQVYKTVKIGKQTWMAQNLNYADSVTMPSLIGKTKCAEIESYEPNCKVAGRLYTYAAAIDSVALSADGNTCGYGADCYLGEAYQGVCPEGYHLPTKQDWQELLNYSSDNGASLRAATSLWGTPEPVDTYGFSVLPFGSGSWGWDVSPMMGVTSGSTERYYGVTLGSGGAFILSDEPKEWAAAVRCVKTEPIPAGITSTDLIWYGGNKLEDASAGTYLKQTNLLSGYTWVSGAAKSSIQFPAPVATGDVISDSIIARCGGGICGKVGSLSEEAYIGFDVDASANLEEWGGVCLTYKASTDSIIMYLGTGGGADTAYSHSIAWNLYHVTLPATDVVTTRCFSWLDDFNQYWEGSNEVKLDAYLSHVRDLSFRFKSPTEGATFNIIAIGTYKDKVSDYNTYMSAKANRTSAWDYMNPAKTYGEITDDRDGQKYKTIKIGDQTWMAENLNFETTGGYCYGDDPKNCNVYGRLYTWDAAMSACPDGWYLPTSAEMYTLFTTVSDWTTASKDLRSLTGWNSGGNGTDAFGFSVLPAGRWMGDAYSDMGDFALIWSSTEYESNDAMVMYLYHDDRAFRINYSKNYRFSVRCIKGSEYDSLNNTLTDLRDGQVYRTTKIGDQTWMAQNLNYRYLGGTADLPDSSSFCYENKSQNCVTYGRYYTWSAAMDSAGLTPGNKVSGCGEGSTCSVAKPFRGICPAGWHLPSLSEFTTLISVAGGTVDAAKKLMSTTVWTDGFEATDEYGFTAYPLSSITLKNNSTGFGVEANFLCSSNRDIFSIWNGEAYTGWVSVVKATPIRCLKN